MQWDVSPSLETVVLHGPAACTVLVPCSPQTPLGILSSFLGLLILVPAFCNGCFPGRLDTAHMFMRDQKCPHANQKLCVAAKPHSVLMEDRLAIMPSH